MIYWSILDNTDALKEAFVCIPDGNESGVCRVRRVEDLNRVHLLLFSKRSLDSSVHVE
jgi:hypothetical protein